MGIGLAGAVLLTLAASFSASASADERGRGRDGEPTPAAPADETAPADGMPPADETPPADERGAPPANGSAQERASGSAQERGAETEAGNDPEEQRVARWRIVDQPSTRWEGRGSERLARTGAGTGGAVFPVLPLGAGLTCVGLGVGLLGYRLRRA
ncbi:hypothetical protein SAMN06297387_109194 [Streptomyces zhaozhouensis]|uniref:MYXO-CTERM domain-containing protein n=1 Tax=Streptomyces zhaozhouensis TaxID=1300267 RepID=A0A286DX62_9ACTN|nr:hypothetical protein SAMN06297387_109194 [Streptomyces zhaozhouensis]